MTEYALKPLNTDTWAAFADLAERHNGVWGGCWCTWFHGKNSENEPKDESGRAKKQRLVHEGRAHAALVFDGEEAVAWCEYGPPAELPNIHHRKEYLATLDLMPDYRLTCFFVDRRYRRKGLATVALRGAVDLIAQAGGGVVEGYPHDIPPGKKMSASFLYNVTRTLYEREGFIYIRPKGQGNCVMRRPVAPS
jgi:GNAT superfamily N-acetyltransferase